MALSHPTAVRNTIADHVVDKIDAGGGVGKLVLLTAANAVVATMLFPATAFGNGGASVAGQASITAGIGDNNSAGNASPVTKFEIRDFANVVIIQGTVTQAGGGGDIILPTTTITAGDWVIINTMTYTATP